MLSPEDNGESDMIPALTELIDEWGSNMHKTAIQVI